MKNSTVDTPNCHSNEIATKSYFLGPRAENADWLRHQVQYILDHFFQWRKDYKPLDGNAIARDDQKNLEFKKNQNKIHEMIQNLCHRYENEVPQFSPRYIGHMYSEISLPSILGNFLATLHNPNIISSEASRVGAFLEEEAINELSEMLFFDPTQSRGHFTSCGTIANLEALWRARYCNDHFLSLGTYLNLNHHYKLSYFECCHMGWDSYAQFIEKYNIKEETLKKYSYVYNGPWKTQDIYHQAFGKNFQGSVVLVPNSKHYSWLKSVSILGLGDVNFIGIKLTSDGSVNLIDLEEKIEFLKQQDIPIMMNVSILGSTELGKCDKVDKINELLKKYSDKNIHIWHHIDAAYGGYFATTIDKTAPEKSLLPSSIVKSYMALKDVQSITIDPHKLGYVPYACGAIIVRDPDHYKVSAFEAKYIQSPEASIDRWMKTLEGSRSSQGATSVWLSNKTIGLNREGHGLILERTIKAREELEHHIKTNCPGIVTLEKNDLNLLCLAKIEKCKTLAEANIKTHDLINQINNRGDFIVSKTTLKSPEYEDLIVHHCKLWNIKEDSEELILLRLTIMNPFFLNKETKTSFLNEFSQLIMKK